MIEFAAVGSLLLVLLLAFFDLGILFFNDVNLHNATRSAARQLRIVAGQPPAAQQAALDQAFCDRLILIDCAAVEIDVRGYDDVDDVDSTTRLDAGGRLADPQVETIAANQLVFVTALYRHTMSTPIGLLLRTAALPAEAGTARLLLATVLTRAEPG